MINLIIEEFSDLGKEDFGREVLGQQANLVIQKSDLSTLALQYAEGKNIEDLIVYIKLLQEYKQTQNLLIIVLYTDYTQLSPEIQNQYTHEFFDKYYEFYRVYLPIHFGIVANFIKVHDENGTHITSQYIQDQINAIIEHDRVCQANVVCYRIQNNEPEFLVLKRNPEKGSFWQSITGGVHIQGLLFGNALRELEEELFITGKENNLTGTDYVFWYIGKEGYELSEYVFGYKLEDTDEITLSDEHTEYAFLPLDEAIEMVKYDGNKEGIRRVYKVIS
jgi:8-oxo-dGTP pyrophosphatase MutT (NUDIX family)